MCGIVGIISNEEVSSTIIDVLKKLEYRGYDSAGIATISDNEIKITSSNKRIWGVERTQIQNTIIGVSQGFQKRLKLVGIGFRVQKQNNSLQFKLGFSHEITFQLPDGIDAICPKPDQIVLFGIRKDYLNQTAAKIRSLRKPDSYKGKGIQFEDEILILKEGKKK